jgi:hypothetical protein
LLLSFYSGLARGALGGILRFSNSLFAEGAAPHKR